MVVWKIVALVISQIEVFGEVVIGGSSRRYKWKKKKTKEAAGQCELQFGETAPFHCYDVFFFI